MATIDRVTQATHEVTNQAVPLEDYNAFSSDRVLREAVRREGGDFALERIERVGELAGRAETIRWGFEADEHRPTLTTHDRFGHRIDEVELSPRLSRAAEPRSLERDPRLALARARAGHRMSPARRRSCASASPTRAPAARSR